MYWATKFLGTRPLNLFPMARETWSNTLKISEVSLYLGGKWIGLDSNDGLQNCFPELFMESQNC